MKTQIIYKGLKENSTEDICFVKKSDLTYLVSRSCEKLDCELLKKNFKKVKIPEKNSTFGSPAFKLCYEVGGVPQIFTYLTENNTSESTDRCIFGTNDFVENSFLLDLWRGKFSI